MPDVPAARIGEEAVAIEYRLDRCRAPCRVALSEDVVKIAYQKILDVVRHALWSHVCAQTCAWPPSANDSAPVTKLEPSDAMPPLNGRFFCEPACHDLSPDWV